MSCRVELAACILMEMAMRVVWVRGLAIMIGRAHSNVSLAWQMP